ncbi:hypothetical protein BAU15_03705 [Enterococcus sp. JM4C]|uniref:hypothetical protein n=1 Tax=Candidatus Enterococcus huntleyi TaxID=1857217 RepID=UPI00137B488B|nr:hypothetical protein [Enterococcus sp. JM4C]KAF1295657.1 hypothetical protein BAU15_03705 [Enterococcus sp. JM4C]
MKKIGLVILLGGILLLGAMNGLVGVKNQLADISKQDYKINLKKAIQLYQKETKIDSCTAISFDTLEEANTSYKPKYTYIFENGETLVHINPDTGKITKRKQKLVKMSQQKRKIKLAELTHMPMPNEAMKQALDRLQGHNNQVVAWRLQKEHLVPSYTVTIKQNHAQKRVLVE